MQRTEIGEVRLTGRERDVLTLLAQGLQLEEIAARLGAANRTHAVAIAIRGKLI